jgi:imidazolonepropionase-like amidohydrolase
MTTVLRAGLLIDGTGREPLRDAVLVIERGRVTQVGAEATLSAPRDAEVLDYSEQAVLPGLMDCHVHFILSSSDIPLRELEAEDDFTLMLRAAEAARLALRAGITTVRDLGDRNGTMRALRDAITAGLVPGPRLLWCGAPITPTGGHCHFLGGEADGEDEVRRLARRQLKQGADGLKVMATGGAMTARSNPRRAHYTVEQIRAAVDEARRAGVSVAAHAHGAAGIRNAVAAGVDTIEHGTWLPEEEGEPPRFDEQVAAQMARQGTRVVPTLTPGRRLADRLAATSSASPPDFVRHRPTVLGFHRRLRELGVRFAAGTDVGATHTPADSLPGELALMVEELGFSPLEAIQAATQEAARAMRIAGDRGTLAPGQRADLLVVNGDPSVDVGALRRVHAVLKDGAIVVDHAAVLHPPLPASAAG